MKFPVFYFFFSRSLVSKWKQTMEKKDVVFVDTQLTTNKNNTRMEGCFEGHDEPLDAEMLNRIHEHCIHLAILEERKRVQEWVQIKNVSLLVDLAAGGLFRDFDYEIL
jgi:hypothetical protein